MLPVVVGEDAQADDLVDQVAEIGVGVVVAGAEQHDQAVTDAPGHLRADPHLGAAHPLHHRPHRALITSRPGSPQDALLALASPRVSWSLPWQPTLSAAPTVVGRVGLVAAGPLAADALGTGAHDGRALVTVRVPGGAARLRRAGFDARAARGRRRRAARDRRRVCGASSPCLTSSRSRSAASCDRSSTPPARRSARPRPASRAGSTAPARWSRSSTPGSTSATPICAAPTAARASPPSSTICIRAAISTPSCPTTTAARCGSRKTSTPRSPPTTAA